MQKVANIAKNTSYFTFALILQKVISFSYFVVLARNLDPNYLGKYYLAISFTSLFAIFIDLGLANVLTRQIARDSSDYEDKKEDVKSLIKNVLGLKIILAVLASLACLLMIDILNYPEITRKLIYVSIISMNLDSFTAAFYSMIRGFHNLVFESIGAILFQIVVLMVGLSMLYSNSGLVWIISALAVASVFNFLYSYVIASRTLKFRLLPSWDFSSIKNILVLTLPFAFYGIFQKAYMYLDTVLLSKLANDHYVGIYQVPFKIVFALQFLPMAFVASLYPAMSSYWIDNKKQLAISFERALNYLLIISIPISVGIISLADKIILLFKSGYEEAIFPMQIIICALIFIFLNFPVGSLLNATERQKVNTFNMGIVLIFSVGLNFILIPRYQAVGASVTVFATNFLMFVLGMIWVPKIIDFNFKKIVVIFLKVFASAFLMSVFVVYFKDYLNIFLNIIIGALLYFVFLFILKGFKKEDAMSIYQSFLRKKSNG